MSASRNLQWNQHDGKSSEQLEPASLYLHIPFCERKCIYCDFYSVEGLGSMDAFLGALAGEIAAYRAMGEGRHFHTIFFGGGTPSLLSVPQVGSLLDTLRSTFDVEGNAEVTLETNPGTVDAEKLEGFRKAGVNRLSVGIQSLNSEELSFLGRIHTAEEAKSCVRSARQAGFGNISIDLIYSLPGQTLAAWDDTLRGALSLQPDHISAYGLIVEDHTPLQRLVSSRQISPNPPDREAEFFEYTMDVMAREGFEQYEISNYARPGFRSVHNMNYWLHGEYLGFGPSAHSFWKQEHDFHTPRRWWNVRSIARYIEMTKSGGSTVDGDEFLTEEVLAVERLFLGLRSGGVELSRLCDSEGRHMVDPDGVLVGDLCREGLVRVEEGILRLTSRGFLVCDEVTARLMQ